MRKYSGVYAFCFGDSIENIIILEDGTLCMQGVPANGFVYPCMKTRSSLTHKSFII